ncbi:MAG TPA: recombination protein RecR [Bacteroidetes bacterium]|nr:recombination protein RecR [Bacteroidota bacterium]
MLSSSKKLNEAVDAVASLPGIGKKTALRIVLHLINGHLDKAQVLSDKLIELSTISYCKKCNNISDNDICDICSSTGRDQSTVCVVENIRDLIAIENTQQYNGVYHVLGGLISPLDGISPDQLNFDNLVSRINDPNENVKELIMALSPTIEGETTIYYLSGLLPENIKISLISRGIAFGGELEYADEFTLGRSILTRIPYDSGIK